MAFSPAATPARPGWQDRALDRTLADARARDVERMERCVAAARELATETASAAFTVAQIAARAGLSLKSFYRCFPGKDELLLALLEDDSHRRARASPNASRERDTSDRRAARVRDRAVRADSRSRAQLGYASVLVARAPPAVGALPARAPGRARAARRAARRAHRGRHRHRRSASRRGDDVPRDPAGHRRRRRRTRHRLERAGGVPLALLLGRAARADGSQRQGDAPSPQRIRRQAAGAEHADGDVPARARAPRPRTTRSSPSTITSSSPRTCSKAACPRSSPTARRTSITLDDGRETWVYEDGFYPQVGLNAVAGRPKAEWSMEPARFDEMRRGCYDVEARVADMDLDGVYATLCFPSLIAGFAGTIFAKQQGPRARPRVPARVERLAHRRVGRPASRSHHPAAARVAARPRDRGRRRPPQRRARASRR